jgi:nucleotide-binding universal stress UspA family protein
MIDKKEGKMVVIKRILCPTDFSEPSMEGIKVGNDLALRFSGGIILIHVIPPVHSLTPPYVSTGKMLGDYYEELVRVAGDALKEMAESHFSKDISVQTFVIRGNPPDEIVRTAAEKRADIIVMATHGASGLHRRLFGSVAEKVLRSSTVPVMTVPASEKGSVSQ